MGNDGVVVESFSCRSSGTALSGSKVRYSWLVALGHGRHSIEFTDSKASGMKRVFVDGKEIHRKQVIVSPHFKYSWKQDGHRLSIVPKEIQEMQDPKKVGKFMTSVKDAFNKTVDCSFHLTIDDIPFQVFRRSELRLALPPNSDNDNGIGSSNTRSEIVALPSQRRVQAQPKHAKSTVCETENIPDSYSTLEHSEDDEIHMGPSLSDQSGLVQCSSIERYRCMLESHNDDSSSSESEQPEPKEFSQHAVMQRDVACTNWDANASTSSRSKAPGNSLTELWEPWAPTSGALLSSPSTPNVERIAADSRSRSSATQFCSNGTKEAWPKLSQYSQQQMSHQLPVAPHQAQQEKQQWHPWVQQNSPWQPWPATTTSSGSLTISSDAWSDVSVSASNLASKSSPWDAWPPATATGRNSDSAKHSSPLKAFATTDPWTHTPSTSSWAASASVWPSA